MDTDFIGSYLISGIRHVLTGIDHLLFACGIVLALTGFWQVFKVIGIFTLAHSLTVVATAVHGSALLPDNIVEPIVGASIVFVAVENLLRPNAIFGPRRITVVFLLGLFHGMAFGGILLEKLEGIPGNAAAWAIAAFCIGVEVGHLCVVAPLSGILKIGRDAGGEQFRRPALVFGSLFVALGGCYYFYNTIAPQIGWPELPQIGS
jgi:hydrogenase/urease accessory protein HupE